MEEPHFYRVDVKSEDLKTGFAGSPDIPALDVASPPQFGGPAGVWSPEHLFVASVASCLMTTFRAVADNSGVEVLEYSDSASGMLVRGDDRLYRFTDVTLRPRVVVADPNKVDRVLRLIDKAEQVCLISRSIAATVHVEPRVIVASTV